MSAKEHPTDQINNATKARIELVNTSIQQLHEAVVASGEAVDGPALNAALTLLNVALVSLVEIAGAQTHLASFALAEEQRIQKAAEEEVRGKNNPTRNFIGKPA